MSENSLAQEIDGQKKAITIIELKASIERSKDSFQILKKELGSSMSRRVDKLEAEFSQDIAELFNEVENLKDAVKKIRQKVEK